MESGASRFSLLNFLCLSSLSERSQQASTHANLPVELVQEKNVYLCIYLFIFPQTEQDHVQMKVLERKREKGQMIKMY